ERRAADGPDVREGRGRDRQAVGDRPAERVGQGGGPCAGRRCDHPRPARQRYACALEGRRPHGVRPGRRAEPANRPRPGHGDARLSAVGRFRLPLTLPRVERSEDERVVAGVCAGIAQTLAVDATFVRLAFTLFAFAGGAGIAAYLGAWALMPEPGAALPSQRRRIAGAVLLVWSAILALRGIGLADTVVWPLALVGAG